MAHYDSRLIEFLLHPCGDGMTNFQGISAMVFLIVNCAHDKVIIVGDMCDGEFQEENDHE